MGDKRGVSLPARRDLKFTAEIPRRPYQLSLWGGTEGEEMTTKPEPLDARPVGDADKDPQGDNFRHLVTLASGQASHLLTSASY